MIQITRRQLYDFEQVLKKSIWHGTPRGLRPPVVFDAGANGLSIRSHSSVAAVEFLSSKTGPASLVRLPAAALSDFATRNDAVVELTCRDDQTIAEWNDAGIPLHREYRTLAADSVDVFPERPTSTLSNGLELLAAIQRAGQATDPTSSRYALDHIQLQGPAGRVAGTDGRQLVVEQGFQFPWEGEKLVRWRPVLGLKQLRVQPTVDVGEVDNGVYFGLGSWNIWLFGDLKARFPKIDDVIPAPQCANHVVAITHHDIEFLLEALKRLPGADDHQTVDLVLADQVSVRVQSSNQAQPTELVLSQSRFEGQPDRYATDRRFLVCALEQGFREVRLFGPNRALCQRTGRTYLWALCHTGPEMPKQTVPIRLVSADASWAQQWRTRTRPQRAIA